MAEGNYGTRHLMEEEMREKGMGVFENKMAPAPENKSLSSMTKADLIALAEKEGTDLTDATNNDERIAAIEKARKAKYWQSQSPSRSPRRIVALIPPTRIMTKCLRPISRRRGSGWRISPALCWCRAHSPRQWKRSAPMCHLIVVR